MKRLNILLWLSLLCAVVQAEGRYADHSVLAEGCWVKISVPKTGIFQLTDSLVQAAGFADVAHVRVFGYGGAVQPEKLLGSYLEETDDLKEVHTFTTGGRKLFYAQGPVSWNTNTTAARDRNTYSNYGCYFLTEGETTEALADSASFAATFYPSPDDYHTLYEIDDFAWYKGGRNLYDGRILGLGVDNDYQLEAAGTDGTLTFSLSFDGPCTFQLFINGIDQGSFKPGTSAVKSGALADKFALAGVYTWNQKADGLLRDTNTVTIRQTSGGVTRLDYLSLRYTEPRPMPALDGHPFPLPLLMGSVENQDLHADGPADMVIIIPESRLLQEQAERLARFHEEADGLRVRVVDAGQLYNEFSSGTPDANAYRRYLKMLYDRAEVESDKPRYLLLMGDGAWDNRMLHSDWTTCRQEDFLLCYESDNSYSELRTYTTDDYFCLLDDGEGGNLLKTDKSDVAVGRFPVRTPQQAAVMIDKVIAYHGNAAGGNWQNTICFMGDEGNQNMHMNDCEMVLAVNKANTTDFDIRKIYFDSYPMTNTNVGERIPGAHDAIVRQMQEGALVMNYTGHAAANSFSHSIVMQLQDFADSTSLRLPLWLTASCNVMPFDTQQDNIGETAVLNPNGGAIAFFGTTHTVYAYFNQFMNRAFMKRLLTKVGGQYLTMGDAARMAKIDLVTSGDDTTENKLQYTFLGDPALKLALPQAQAVIETINGMPAGDAIVQLRPGQKVTVGGSITDGEEFNGKVTLTVRDAEEQIRCLRNTISDADTAFVYRSRPHIVAMVTDTVADGQFNLTFVVPRDLRYLDGLGQMLVCAVSDDKRITAHGSITSFTLGGDEVETDSEDGPVVVCYLNDPTFENGSTVGPVPHFMAEIFDEDGINLSNSGIGHNMELVVDGDAWQTYDLNFYFDYLPGDYQRGIVDYPMTGLTPGAHRLRFRVWDVHNNPTEAELLFVYNPNHAPQSGILDINASAPSSHEIYDAAGRRVDRQQRARQGLYLYRMPNGKVRKMMKAGQ